MKRRRGQHRGRMARELASRQLRAWQYSGVLGLNDLAFTAMVAGAQRLGFPDLQTCCSAGCWPDMMSEAIEDVETE